MIRRPALLLALALAPLAAAAGLFDAETRLEPAALSAKWDGLAGRLAAVDWVRAPFTERRYFSVRKMPVVLKGDLILSHAHGLSLRYENAALTGWPLVIIDQSGLLLRDDQGREMTPPGGPRLAGVQRVLLDVLRLDLPRLAENFTFHAEGTVDAWRIGLEPRTADARHTASAVTLSGSGTSLQKIVLERTAQQRVEIEIGDPVLGRTADETELKARYRKPMTEAAP